MTNYNKKEQHCLTKIYSTIQKLDETLLKIDESTNSLSYFLEQEKAIHEIKVILRQAKITYWDKCQ